MKFSCKKWLIAGVAVSVMALSQAAQAGNQDTAFDERDQIIKNTWGNCVRTKWTAENDACAPAPEPAPMVKKAPPPPPTPRISLGQRTVYFNFNSSKLTPEATAKLDQLVNIVKSSKGIVQANVVGYADEIGSDAYNIRLSEKRAARVENYLAERISIPTQVLGVRGLGETNSVTNCDGTKGKAKIACLAKDRRVEVEFKYKH